MSATVKLATVRVRERGSLGSMMWAPIHSIAIPNEGEPRIPPAPTLLQFPALPNVQTTEIRQLSLPELERQFRVKQIRQLEPALLHNVVASHPADPSQLEDLIPSGFLPPTSWNESAYPSASEQTGSESVSSETLSNGAAIPGRESYHNRIRELSFNPDDVYKVLARQPGSPALRVVHYRKFWLQLKQMGGYWDTSKDNLDFSDPAVLDAYERQELDRVRNKRRPSGQPPSPPTDKSNSNGFKPSSPGRTTAQPAKRSPTLPRRRTPPTPAKKSPTLTTSISISTAPSHQQTTRYPARSWSGSSDYGFDGPAEPPKIHEAGQPPREFKYTGRRDSCGVEMPSTFRGEAVRALVEPVAHAFGCLVDPAKTQPRLYFGTTKLDVDHVARVYRGPRDRGRSRAGIREGPLMVIQCTNELDFSGRDPVVGKGGKKRNTSDIEVAPDEMIDELGLRYGSESDVAATIARRESQRNAAGARHLFREVGALLALALTRDREGREERKFGNAQWWAEKPRNGASEGEGTGQPLIDDEGAAVTDEDVELAAEAESGTEANAGARRGSVRPDDESKPKDNGQGLVKNGWGWNGGSNGNANGNSQSWARKPSTYLMDPKERLLQQQQRRRGGGASAAAMAAASAAASSGDDNAPSRGSGWTTAADREREAAAEKARKVESQREIRRAVRRKMIARSQSAPEAVWERLVDFTRIGKAEGDEWDVVYMLSSINHHAAVVRMEVHLDFLAHLDRDRSGAVRLRDPARPPNWYGVRVSRSRWYDLFTEADRVELTRGLWGAMGWMMRRTDEPSEGDSSMS